MTKEEKQLLLKLKDLCARLPNGVKVTTTNPAVELGIISGVSIKGKISVRTKDADIVFECTEIKPYLRPMSSMTEEEKNEYKHLVAFSGSPNGAANFVDWLNKKMFAYRTIDGKDMFELGLAIEAPEGMYNII